MAGTVDNHIKSDDDYNCCSKCILFIGAISIAPDTYYAASNQPKNFVLYCEVENTSDSWLSICNDSTKLLLSLSPSQFSLII